MLAFPILPQRIGFCNHFFPRFIVEQLPKTPEPLQAADLLKRTLHFVNDTEITRLCELLKLTSVCHWIQLTRTPPACTVSFQSALVQWYLRHLLMESSEAKRDTLWWDCILANFVTLQSLSRPINLIAASSVLASWQLGDIITLKATASLGKLGTHTHTHTHP